MKDSKYRADGMDSCIARMLAESTSGFAVEECMIHISLPDGDSNYEYATSMTFPGRHSNHVVMS